MPDHDPAFGGTVRRAYEQGAAITGLAAEHGLSVHRIRALLIAAGATIRLSGAAPTPPATPEMVEAYCAGTPIKEIGEAFDEPPNRVCRMLVNAGVELRRKGSPSSARLPPPDSSARNRNDRGRSKRP